MEIVLMLPVKQVAASKAIIAIAITIDTTVTTITVTACAPSWIKCVVREMTDLEMKPCHDMLRLPELQVRWSEVHG
jgi:hypothetical protein